MPRPRCVRRIVSEIRACSVLPFEGDAELARKLFGGTELITLEPDEVEALRLADLDHRYQEEAAHMMGVSRPTFGRILERARTKVADALINGKALNIERAKAPCLERAPFVSDEIKSGEGKENDHAANTISELGEQTMKIAFISDDGITISHHFGRAAYYIVLTIENGQIVGREQRSKLGHNHFVNQNDEHHGASEASKGHGFQPGAQERHTNMLQAIVDCKALIVGGMGAGAYQSLQQAGIEPIVTDMEDIESAAEAYIAGTIKNRIEYLD